MTSRYCGCGSCQVSDSAEDELGHLLETFAVGELMKQASSLDGIAAVGHWRTRDGDEVDLVIERDDGAVVAVEVKAAQRVGTRELAPLYCRNMQ